ncbi:MAG: hypothetical protein U0325_31425 [Polyangiales bacterium]
MHTRSGRAELLSLDARDPHLRAAGARGAAGRGVRVGSGGRHGREEGRRGRVGVGRGAELGLSAKKGVGRDGESEELLAKEPLAHEAGDPRPHVVEVLAAVVGEDLLGLPAVPS